MFTNMDTRYGDPDILKMFDAWWSTPMAFKDPDVDPSEWDAVVDSNGNPIVIAANSTDMIGPELALWLDTHQQGITVAVRQPDRAVPVIIKITPETRNPPTFSKLDPTFTWDIILNDAGTDNTWRLMGTSRDYQIAVTWPLGQVDGGNLNRISIG